MSYDDHNAKNGTLHQIDFYLILTLGPRNGSAIMLYYGITLKTMMIIIIIIIIIITLIIIIIIILITIIIIIIMIERPNIDGRTHFKFV